MRNIYKKIILIFLAITILGTTLVYSETILNTNSLNLLSFFVNEVYQRNTKLDYTTSAETILQTIVFNQYFEDEYLMNDNFLSEITYERTIDENNISHELGYSKYYAYSIDNLMKEFFNFSDADINKLHKEKNIHYYNSNEKKWYYKDGHYYVSQQGVDGRKILDILNYKILEAYGNDTYKLNLTCRERYGWDDEYIGPSFSIFCILRINNNSFTVYGISKSNDISLKKEIKVVLNGENIEFDQPPIIIDGRTLVPLRAIFEAMGATVDWNDKTKTVTSRLNPTTIQLKIGNNILYKNDTAVALDVPAQLINGYTMVPARAIAEAFGADVDWEGNTQTVYITTKVNTIILD